MLAVLFSCITELSTTQPKASDTKKKNPRPAAAKKRKQPEPTPEEEEVRVYSYFLVTQLTLQDTAFRRISGTPRQKDYYQTENGEHVPL